MRVPRSKRTRDVPIREMEAPRRVRIPVNKLKPIVSTGDRVAAGDLILASPPETVLQYRRHAPLTGIVTEIHTEVIIEGEAGEPRPILPVQETTVAAAREAGLVGMGGGGFPTYVKLSSSDRRIDTVIVNGCESEPYVTCDHRVLAECRHRVENGLRLAREALGAETGVVADAEATYPGGDERLLVEKVLGRKVPPSKRPVDVGAVVLNVQTVLALDRAVTEGRPLIDRVITVEGGAVSRPGNYLVRVGTEVRHVLAECGTDETQIAAMVCGGPMMGVPATLDTPISASTIAVLALTSNEISRAVDEPCIRCGQCHAVCPYGLAPGMLVRSPTSAVLRCVGCGACEFACPSHRGLVARMRELTLQYREECGVPV